MSKIGKSCKNRLDILEKVVFLLRENIDVLC